MRQKKITYAALAAAMFSILIAMTFFLHYSWAEPNNLVQVALLVGELRTEQDKEILAVYEQILKEEGFPYRVVWPAELTGYAPGELKGRYQAIVAPEAINSTMTRDTADIISSYVRDQGGPVLFSLDPATVAAGGDQQPAPLLADLLGVKYDMPAADGKVSSYSGSLYFKDKETGRAWGITPGKLDQDNAYSTYAYGKIKFDHTRALNVDAQVAAMDRINGAEVPVITVKNYDSGGSAVYANVPLAKCKLRSDDLLPRSVLRTFLIDHAKIPRLVNSPDGMGGFVFNLHICSGAYFKALTVMLMQGLFNSEMPLSIHITAGPDTYKLGDNMGYYAESEYRGRPVLEVLQNYGEIGSHGGWAHNFFAYNLQYLPRGKAFQLLEWNSRALEAVTGKKVIEYSAPGGNHPFWVNNKLEEMGVNSYYYAGDSGSSPSHPRIYESYASQNLWAFPITPYRQYASLEEMERGHVPEEEVKQWIEDLIDFSAEEKVIRMVYTHPSDTRFCMEAIRTLEEKALAEQGAGRIKASPMSRFAEFLNRYAKTKCEIKKADNDYSIVLENPEGLKDITVAVYVGEENKIVMDSDVKTSEEDGWLYITVTSNPQKKTIDVNTI
ncbi:hypothetical protein ACOBQJ_05615 [Pelotomaculum propionicicum]|uniref:hypothetical protein n=1 Tax=Pelotomaculum propionicicum TaxID=258475 RepID=UPI003B796214